MHVPRSSELHRDGNGRFELVIEPGRGTAPDVRATLDAGDDRRLWGVWSECFSDWNDFLGYCVPQDRALSVQRWYNRVTRQEIVLGIALQECRPLTGMVKSEAARGIVGDAQPLCFYVPTVNFRFDGEQYDRERE